MPGWTLITAGTDPDCRGDQLSRAGKTNTLFSQLVRQGPPHWTSASVSVNLGGRGGGGESPLSHLLLEACEAPGLVTSRTWGPRGELSQGGRQVSSGTWKPGEVCASVFSHPVNLPKPPCFPSLLPSVPGVPDPPSHPKEQHPCFALPPPNPPSLTAAALI